jgi:hypothetical protein
MSLMNREQSYFGRPDPWAELDGEEWQKRNKRKKRKIDPMKGADCPISLDGLEEVETLGFGWWGM